MSQTRKMSALETVMNQCLGFIAAVLVLVLVGPSLGIVGAGYGNGTLLTLILTGVSVLRTYGLRRLFNWKEKRKEHDADLFI